MFTRRAKAYSSSGSVI